MNSLSESDLRGLNRALLLRLPAFLIFEFLCEFCCIFLFICLLLIDLFELRCLFKGLPLLCITHGVELELLQLGQHLTDQGKERLQDEVDEAWLTLRNLGSFTVAQKRDRKSLFFLNVTLSEEFFEKELGPLYSDLK